MNYLALAKQVGARLRAKTAVGVQDGGAFPTPSAGPFALRPDALEAILDTPLDALSVPLAVDSAILGRIYLVRGEAQAQAVRAEGGVSYTPAEVAILRETWRTVGRDEWAHRLRAIHMAKVAFEGRIEFEGDKV